MLCCGLKFWFPGASMHKAKVSVASAKNVKTVLLILATNPTAANKRFWYRRLDLFLVFAGLVIASSSTREILFSSFVNFILQK